MRKRLYNEGSARENSDDDNDDDCDDCEDKNRTKKKHKTKKNNNHNSNNNYMFCSKSLHLTPLLRASCHGQNIRKEKRGRK